MEDEEIWAIPPEFSRYKVSTLGRIASVNSIRPKILNPKPHPSGYIIVHLFNDNKENQSMRVHRLVALTFLVNPDNKLFVDYINHKRDDNRLVNLRWSNSEENSKDKTPATKFKGRVVVQYDLSMNKMKEWLSTAEIRRYYKVSYSDIAKAAETQTILKWFYWKFLDTIPIDNEIWKPIKVNEHLISVSSVGRVKVLSGTLTYGHKNNSGYLAVRIGDYTLLVHRLICLAFKPVDDPYNYFVNHIDSDKHNNMIENLEWVTPRENTNHSLRNIDTKSIRPVVKMALDGTILNFYKTLKEAAQEFDTHNCSIINACQGKYKNSNGYKWRFCTFEEIESNFGSEYANEIRNRKKKKV